MTLYDGIAILGALLLVYVAQKTTQDVSCSEDARWLRWTRRGAFFATALAALGTVGCQPPPQMVILVGTAVIILAVNAVVLHMRQPPAARHGNATQSAVYRIAEARKAARRAF